MDGQGNYWSDYAGYDADGDGRGDMAYKSERLFENLMQQEPLLRLFIYSPASNAIDFAARAFPLVKPKPKLVDDTAVYGTADSGRCAPPAAGGQSGLDLAGRWPWSWLRAVVWSPCRACIGAATIATAISSGAAERLIEQKAAICHPTNEWNDYEPDDYGSKCNETLRQL